MAKNSSQAPSLKEIEELPVILELQDVLTKLKKSHDKLGKRVKTLETTVKDIQEGLLQRGNS